MTGAPTTRLVFVGEGLARRLVTLFEPPGAVSRCLLFIPAFAEEMNKSRAQVARAARSLAAQGVLVMVPDLFGTGDSAGDFADATWRHWMDDLHGAVTWLREAHDCPLALWSMRSGALLASQLLADGVSAYASFIWQPVLSGAQFVRQFLRLRTAADMIGGGDGQVLKIEDMRRMLAEGRSVEVAGYTLGADLFAGFEAAVFQPSACPTYLYEISTRPDAALTPALARAVEQWQAQGAKIHARAVQGAAFWQTVEIEFVPRLLECFVDDVMQEVPCLTPSMC